MSCCDWKSKYDELFREYKKVTAVSNLCSRLIDFIETTYNRMIFMVKSNIALAIPYYYHTFKILAVKLLNFIRLFGEYQPHVSQYKCKVSWLNSLVTKSNNRHVNNLVQVVNFKCLFDKKMIKQFKELIVKEWSNESNKIDLKLPEVSPWDTDLLQNILVTTDKRFRLFKVELNHITRRVVFSSERQVGYLREMKRVSTGKPFITELARSKGKGKSRSIAEMKKEDEIKNFLCFFMNDLEALALCVDADINNNEFFIPTVMGDKRTVFCQLAGDKQTKYGYSESIASLTNINHPMSANRSIPTILIIGDFADERSSHVSVLQKMKKEHGYNKSSICAGLTDWSLIISTVLYSCDEQSKIQSRYSYSAVAIWEENVPKNTNELSENYDEKKHTMVDEDVIVLKNKFQQMDYHDCIDKSQLYSDKVSNVANKKNKRRKNHKSWSEPYGKYIVKYIYFLPYKYLQFIWLFYFFFCFIFSYNYD